MWYEVNITVLVEMVAFITNLTYPDDTKIADIYGLTQLSPTFTLERNTLLSIFWLLLLLCIRMHSCLEIFYATVYKTRKVVFFGVPYDKLEDLE